MDECAHEGCLAPADVAWDWNDTYSGPEGDGIIPGARWNCAAGHWWTAYGEPIIDPDKEAHHRE